MPQPNRFVFTGLFVTCSSLLICELLLTRIFSVCLWYHFAFFVISIAMFGLGLGGIFVQLKKNLFDEKTIYKQLFYFTLYMAATALLAPVILFKTNIPQSIFHVFDEKTVLFLIMAFYLSSLPFFFGGLITSIIFSHFSKHISKLYFADLIGASIGCLLTIPLLEIQGAPTALLINAIYACLGAFFFLYGDSKKPSPKHLAIGGTILLLLFLGAFLNRFNHFFEVQYAKGYNLSQDEFTKWNSISRIAVSKVLDKNLVALLAQKYWGVSKNFNGNYPPARIITINADTGTFLSSFDGDFNKVRWLQYDPPSLVYRLKKNPQTLVIGSGGGKDVLTALSFGASHVTAVELNPIIINDIMLNHYREFSGNIYRNPKVTAVSDEGRNFVASNKNRYDIIQLTYVDTTAATSGGAYIFAENNLYTKDSFKDFLKHLKPEGIFSVCWIDVPGLTGGTRLVSLGISALEEMGTPDTGKHMMVVTYAARPCWIIKNIMLKLTPFTDEEQQKVIDATKKLNFEPTYIPNRDTGQVKLNKIHNMKEIIKELINSPTDREEIYDRFPLNIRATTDDSPFFYFQNHPKNFLKIIQTRSPTRRIIDTNGTVILIYVLIVGIVMVSIFYFIPMIFSGWGQKLLSRKKSEIVPFLFYFSSIGMGFMLLEIVFLQKLLLFLGEPIYTLSATLFTILLFAGLGSLCTNRFTSREPQFYISRAILAVMTISVIYLYILPPIFYFFMGYPKFIKITIAILTLMPLSFLMGMPLPLAIKILHERMQDVIPWMWAVNGATSVLASIIAIILAMNIGYNFVLFVSIIFYLAAFLLAKNCFDPKNL